MVKKQTNGHYEWLEELSLKRKNLYSNVVLVESDDSRRMLELLGQQPAMSMKKKGNEDWYVLDPLNGLRQVTSSSVDKSISYEIKSDINIQQYGFASIIQTVSELLKKGKVVIVLTNFIKTDDTWNTTLLGWSTDDDLMSNDASVVLFVNDRNIFPNEIVSKMN